LINGRVRLLEVENSKEVEMPVNIGNPEERTVRCLAELVLKLTGSSSTIVKEPLPTDDPRERCPDIRRAKALLGWQPEYLVERGLGRRLSILRGSSRHSRYRWRGLHRQPRGQGSPQKRV
jgi:UDP-glucuronate decarboxylase